MDYTAVYNLIIQRAKSRILEEYGEMHHIIPTCIGGTNQTQNKVKLTAKEHFIAHRLLAKMHPNEPKLKYALFLMGTRIKCSSRTYQMLREEFVSSLKSDVERSQKISKSHLGKKRTQQHNENWYNSRSKTGWKCPESKREQQKISMKGDKNPMFGKTHNDAAKQKIRESNTVKVQCPHCKKQGGIAIMKRWHFDKCKT